MSSGICNFKNSERKIMFIRESFGISQFSGKIYEFLHSMNNIHKKVSTFEDSNKLF